MKILILTMLISLSAHSNQYTDCTWDAKNLKSYQLSCHGLKIKKTDEYTQVFKDCMSSLIDGDTTAISDFKIDMKSDLGEYSSVTQWCSDKDEATR